MTAALLTACLTPGLPDVTLPPPAVTLPAQPARKVAVKKSTPRKRCACSDACSCGCVQGAPCQCAGRAASRPAAFCPPPVFAPPPTPMAGFGGGMPMMGRGFGGGACRGGG